MSCNIFRVALSIRIFLLESYYNVLISEIKTPALLNKLQVDEVYRSFE